MSVASLPTFPHLWSSLEILTRKHPSCNVEMKIHNYLDLYVWLLAWITWNTGVVLYSAALMFDFFTSLTTFPFPPATPDTVTLSFVSTQPHTALKRERDRENQGNTNKRNTEVAKVIFKCPLESSAFAQSTEMRNGEMEMEDKAIRILTKHKHRILIDRTAAWNLLQVMKP